MKSKLLLVLTIAIGVSLLFTVFLLFPRSTPTTQVPAVNEVIEDADVTEVETEFEFSATQNEQVALELLESNAVVETQEFGDAGKFVTSINGLAGNNQNYWAFYVNGEYAQQGASQTILQEGDTIKFVYEAIEAQ